MAADSVLIELCDGVADALNNHSFSLPLLAQRAWTSLPNLEDADKLLTSVLPDSRESRFVSRSTKSNEVTIDVGLCQYIGSADGERGKVDALASLIQEVEDFLGDVDNLIRTANLKAIPKETAQFFVRDELIVDRIASFYVTVVYFLFR